MQNNLLWLLPGLLEDDDPSVSPEQRLYPFLLMGQSLPSSVVKISNASTGFFIVVWTQSGHGGTSFIHSGK